MTQIEPPAMDMPETDNRVARLRGALRRLPGPVSLITSCDGAGEPAGMVASAVIPVSMEPPSMLVSVNRDASMHAIITGSGVFCINLLTIAQRAFVAPFSNHAQRDERFDTGNWRYEAGVPWLPDASACIFCDVRDTKLFGTHELFIGEVGAVKGGNGSNLGEDRDGHLDAPLGWMEGDFARFGTLD
ncbi:MAG: flavin reductase family protein [Pontixanthobacter sp.]